MDPLQLIYSWQAIMIAAVASGLTQLAKTIMDIWVGKDKRQNSVVLTRIALPIMPIAFGALSALIIPVRPDFLTQYVEAHTTGTGALITYAIWGGAICGQFADYVFSKFKDLVVSARENKP